MAFHVRSGGILMQGRRRGGFQMTYIINIYIIMEGSPSAALPTFLLYGRYVGDFLVALIICSREP
jgi:hypothetical protein